MRNAPYIIPEWPAPPGVRAASTLRYGGVSSPPFDSFNLGDHVGDDKRHVELNRERLVDMLCLPRQPNWLRQVHGTVVVPRGCLGGCEADAIVSDQPGEVCAVLTADCLPVLFCSQDGERVGAAHAGWRGLCAGVLEETVAKMEPQRSRILAWLGPAIGPSSFEVGEEVVATFVERNAQAEEAFQPTRPGHWNADLYRLARQRLAACGVDLVYGGDCCTYREAERFFSYRRDGRTGRMASLVWLEPLQQA